MFRQNFQNFDENFGQNLLKCSSCTYSTEKKTNLRRHQQTMHLQTHNKDLFCCEISFLDKASYRDHNRIEHKFGHKCPSCQRIFSRRALLKRHQSVHTGFREFSCHLCPYASSHKSNLERHAKIHWRNQPDSTTPEEKPEEKPKISTKTPQISPPKISHSIESILRKNDQKVDQKLPTPNKPISDHPCPVEFIYLQNYVNYLNGLFGQNLNQNPNQHFYLPNASLSLLGKPQDQNQQLTNFNFNYYTL